MTAFCTRIWVACLLVALSLLATADTQVISPQHRSAESLLPPLLELYGDNGVRISHFNNQILVNGSPDAIGVIQSLVEQLDTPVQQFRISVRRERAAGQRISQGHVGGLITEHSVEADVAVRSKRYSTSTANVSRLRIQEGQSARIGRGVETPVITIASTFGQTFPTTTFQQAESFVWVTPRWVDEQVVELAIREQLESLSLSDRQTVSSQQFDTVQRIPFNTWVALGSISQESLARQGSKVFSTGGSDAEQQAVSVFVEWLPRQ